MSLERSKSFKRSIKRKDIFNFNHISLTLDKNELNQLKNLYKTYHKKYICYKWKYKKLNRIKITLNMVSLGLVTTGSIVGGVTLNPIILGCITAPGVLIQGYMTKSNLNNKVNMCKFAFQNYEKVLIQLRSFFRGIEFNDIIFISDLQVLDGIISDLCPTITKMSDKYHKTFTDE